MNKQTFVQTAAVIFTIVGLVHLYRAINQLPLNVGDYSVPVVLSWIAGAVALFLAYTGYRLR